MNFLALVVMASGYIGYDDFWSSNPKSPEAGTAFEIFVAYSDSSPCFDQDGTPEVTVRDREIILDAKNTSCAISINPPIRIDYVFSIPALEGGTYRVRFSPILDSASSAFGGVLGEIVVANHVPSGGVGAIWCLVFVLAMIGARKLRRH